MSSVPAVPTGIGGEQQYLQVWSCSWAWGVQAKGCDSVERGSSLFTLLALWSEGQSEGCGYSGVQTRLMCQLQEFFTVLAAFYVACTGIQMSVRARNCLFAGVRFHFSQGHCRTVAVLGMTHSSFAVGLAVYPMAKSPLCYWCGSKLLLQKLLPVPSKTLFPGMLRQ